MRREIEYIPHITIGNSQERETCEKMAEEWNAEKIFMEGKIEAIDILLFESGHVTLMEKLWL